MPEANGTGRLDRIEANLERASERINQLTEHFHEVVDHHDREFKQLMTWQVLMQDKVERIAAIQETEQKRVSELVLAIRDLIEHIPPQNLR